MDVESFKASGILENYCMGFSTESEKAEVENYARLYPEIQNEINQIRAVFEEYLISNKVEPSPELKFLVMENIYALQARSDDQYVPLIKDGKALEIQRWLQHHEPPDPEMTDVIVMQELPSSEFVTNFFVWAKEGHEAEMHTGFNEYLYVLKGSCTMYFDDVPKDFKAGDIISIPPHVNHYAVVTSLFPMKAIVQRRICA